MAMDLQPRTGGFDARHIWQLAQEELRDQITRPSYETWLRNTVLVGCDDGRTFVIGVPTILARDWLRERYAAIIRDTLSELTQRDVEVVIDVDPAAVPPVDEPAPLPDDDPNAPSDDIDFMPDSLSGSLDARIAGSSVARLNPNFTFSAFVVGNSSHFAHAACRAVADAPGRAYNPLFLYGGVGLGKTHLMHAIGHAVRDGHVRRTPKVAYVTTEKFVNEMVVAIQENSQPRFRERYRTVDVLLVDDIQFLAGKDRTQEEFFHTFNALHEMGRQIVISSDRPPKDIPTLEDRLRSRFEWGLMADIQPPDYETRLAILRSKLGPNSRLVSDDVCSFIAHKVQKNIRELEGALIRVLAHASISGHPVTLETSHRILRDIIPEDAAAPPSMEHIQQIVADFYNLAVEEMKGRRRDKHIVFPRQVAMYLIREETASSLPAIGQAFGGKDHTTVLHAYEKIAELSREDARLQQALRELRTRVRSGR
jgi:chromosomal replication initiator protein